MTDPLHSSTLERLRNAGRVSIAVPTYRREALQPGVVHLGLGAFHRAHQAMVFDRLMQRGDMRWGVFGVAMRSTQLADSLAAQDGLYSVYVAGRDGSSWQVPGGLLATAVASRERARVVQALAARSTRWVTLTITEKGYGEEVARLLVDGLAARQQAGLSGLTIASCDNLGNNGRRLHDLVVAAADTSASGASLATWIDEECAFPSSMVDRIVPAATPQRLQAAEQALGLHDAGALGTESFWEWVIEDNFVDPADASLLASVGVKVVDDVHPFEEAKLRMLNGSHTAMACMGAVAGLPVICDCITQPAVHTFVHDLMTREVAPHLTRPDWAEYRDALLARFANPELKHSVHQIATDSTQKIPQRWPPSILGQLAQGRPVEHLALAAAAWMRYCRGIDEHGQPYAIKDPLAPAVQGLAHEHAGNAAATVRALGGMGTVWGDELSQHAGWHARVATWLAHFDAHGMLASVQALNQQTGH